MIRACIGITIEPIEPGDDRAVEAFLTTGDFGGMRVSAGSAQVVPPASAVHPAVMPLVRILQGIIDAHKGRPDCAGLVIAAQTARREAIEVGRLLDVRDGEHALERKGVTA